MKSSSTAKPANSARSAICSARRTSPPSISIPDLVRAGVKSFKIEGRLKIARIRRRRHPRLSESPRRRDGGTPKSPITPVRPLRAGNDLLPRPQHRLVRGHQPPVSHPRQVRQKARPAARHHHRLRPRLDRARRTNRRPVRRRRRRRLRCRRKPRPRTRRAHLGNRGRPPHLPPHLQRHQFRPHQARPHALQNLRSQARLRAPPLLAERPPRREENAAPSHRHRQARRTRWTVAQRRRSACEVVSPAPGTPPSTRSAAKNSPNNSAASAIPPSNSPPSTTSSKATATSPSPPSTSSAAPWSKQLERRRRRQAGASENHHHLSATFFPIFQSPISNRPIPDLSRPLPHHGPGHRRPRMRRGNASTATSKTPAATRKPSRSFRSAIHDPQSTIHPRHAAHPQARRDRLSQAHRKRRARRRAPPQPRRAPLLQGPPRPEKNRRFLPQRRQPAHREAPHGKRRPRHAHHFLRPQHRPGARSARKPRRRSGSS